MGFDRVEIPLTEREIIEVTVGGECLRDLHRLVDGKSALGELLDTQPITDDRAPADPLSHAFDDVTREAQALL